MGFTRQQWSKLLWLQDRKPNAKIVGLEEGRLGDVPLVRVDGVVFKLMRRGNLSR